MKILITGSRNLTDNRTYSRLEKLLFEVPSISLILHGGAKGVDQMAARFAQENDLPETVLLPDYQRWLAKVAPLKRNEELVKLCTMVIAVYAPGRVRKGGTWYTVQKAIAAGKTVTELLPTGEIRRIKVARLF